MLPLAIGTATAAPPDGADAAPAAVEEPALDWGNYDKVLLTGSTGEPIGLAVLPDQRVLHTARNGVIRLTDPGTGLTKEIAQIDVYANSEDGLQGIAIDPDFEENNWVYLVYAPRTMSGETQEGIPYPETTPNGSAPNQLPAGESEDYWNRWLGYNVLSRFKFDPAEGTIDLGSEQEIIKITAQRGQCCHVGASLAFDEDGNIFVSTGDNTPASAPGASGYAPNNNAPGFNPGVDSRRGAGNTNDLRGAILRISVLDEIDEGAEPGVGTTYTIPEGNLFDHLGDPEAYPADKVREELYVMGLRNPFRISYDAEAGALSWADYGPDAGSANPQRGPMGYVEWQVTTEPINGGWPYCHGPNDGGAYNEWDFATSEPGEFFDCAAPVNNSTWNTGVTVLPPTTEPQIWYGDNPGDQPAEWDGLVTFTSGRGQGPMGGPIYRYDESNESPTKFPAFWDGKPFMGEFSQDYMAVFELDELTTNGTVTEIHNFLPNAALYEQAAAEWSGIIDMEFGPDGSLYVLEYGKGFFRENPTAGLYRIDYSAEGIKAPRAVISTNAIASSEAPFEVTFDASGSTSPGGGELTYNWDFDGDGVFDAQGVEATHTYTEVGQYDAILQVRDDSGRVGLATRQITVGNTAPELSIDVLDGSIFSWGDRVDFTVSVTDAEDGDTPDCRRMSWTFGLGHDEHAHPLVSGTGCEFTIDTPADAVDHGDGEKLFGTLVVQYQDQPHGDAPSVTGEAVLTLKPALQEAEWLDGSRSAAEVQDENASAGFYLGDFASSDVVTFAPMAMVDASTGEAITRIDLVGRGAGTVSFAWDGADTPFATFDFDSEDEWQTVTSGITNRPTASGALTITSTGGVDLDYFEFLVDPDYAERITVPADRVGVQLFSLANWTRQVGIEEVLTTLSQVGIENIEPYGSNFSGWSAEDFRALTDSLGLRVPSSHYNVGEGDFDDTLDFVKTLGQEYVGSGGFASPGIRSYEDTLATAATMNRLGERAVAAGVGKFFGHNHDGEFNTKYEHNGELMSAWEILVAETDPEFVTFELDVAWAAHAGVDVPALIRQYGDRIAMLHVKDATNIAGSGRPSFTNLGEGEVPLQAILAAAAEVDIAYYHMEYDGAQDGLGFVSGGYEYLTGLEAGEPEPPAGDLTETVVVSRCVVGKTVLVASVTNVADEAIDVDVDTAYGTRSTESLAAGATKSFAFTTRAVSIEGGEVAVSSASDSGLDGSEQVAYEAVSCS